MAGKNMRKISILITRADFEKFIRELILFGCVDIETSGDFPCAGLESLAERESVELVQYGANREHLSMLGTDYTLLITGWIPAKSVQNLLTILSGYVHAWDVQEPAPDEPGEAPVKLWPKFLAKFYKGSRRLYTPLANAGDRPADAGADAESGRMTPDALDAATIPETEEKAEE